MQVNETMYYAARRHVNRNTYKYILHLQLNNEIKVKLRLSGKSIWNCEICWLKQLDGGGKRGSVEPTSAASKPSSNINISKKMKLSAYKKATQWDRNDFPFIRRSRRRSSCSSTTACVVWTGRVSSLLGLGKFNISIQINKGQVKLPWPDTDSSERVVPEF